MSKPTSAAHPPLPATAVGTTDPAILARPNNDTNTAGRDKDSAREECRTEEARPKDGEDNCALSIRGISGAVSTLVEGVAARVVGNATRIPAEMDSQPRITAGTVNREHWHLEPFARRISSGSTKSHSGQSRESGTDHLGNIPRIQVTAPSCDSMPIGDTSASEDFNSSNPSRRQSLRGSHTASASHTGFHSAQRAAGGPACQNPELRKADLVFALDGYSFFVFSPRNPFRRFLAHTLSRRWTEPCLLLLIITHWIVLALSSRAKEDSPFGSNHGDWAQLVVNFIFTLEVLAKAVVFQFAFGADRRFRMIAQLFPAYYRSRDLEANGDTGALGKVCTQLTSEGWRIYPRRSSEDFRASVAGCGRDFQPSPSACTSGDDWVRVRKGASLGSSSSNPLDESSSTGASGVFLDQCSEGRHLSLECCPDGRPPVPTTLGSGLRCPFDSIDGVPPTARRKSTSGSRPQSFSAASKTEGNIWIRLPPSTASLHASTHTRSTLGREAKLYSAQVPYLRHTFNRLDLVVVASYWVFLALYLTGTSSWRVFAAIAALRPIRLLAMTEGLSTILLSLKKSAPMLLDVLAFISFFFLLFSIVGLHAFKGSFQRHCTIDLENGSYSVAFPERGCGGHVGEGGEALPSLFPTGHMGSKRPRGYLCPFPQKCRYTQNPHFGLYHFDNIFSALVTTFVIQSGEGWSELMYRAMAAEQDLAAVFFCLVIFVMMFVMVQMFIAVITETFGKIHEESVSAFRPSDSDKDLRSPPSSSSLAVARRFRTYCVRLTHLAAFRYMWVILILVDMILMGFADGDVFSSTHQAEFVPFSHRIPLAIRVFRSTFTAALLVEITIRRLATRTWKTFLKSRANTVDLILAVLTCITLIPPLPSTRAYDYLVVFSLFRSYRIFLAIPRLRLLMSTVFMSLCGIFNLLLFMFFATCVSAASAMQLFGGLYVIDQDNPVMLFDTLGTSFLALFSILTGENWNTLMALSAKFVAPVLQLVASVAYFIIFYAFSKYVITNLFIAVFLENFSLTEDEKINRQAEAYKHKVSRPRQQTGIVPKHPPGLSKNRRGATKGRVPVEAACMFTVGLASRLITWVKMLFASQNKRNQWEARDESGPNKTVGQGPTSSSNWADESNPLQAAGSPAVKDRNKYFENQAPELSIASQYTERSRYQELREKRLPGRNSSTATTSDTPGTPDRLVALIQRYCKLDTSLFEKSLFLLRPCQPLRIQCQKIVGTHGRSRPGIKSFFDYFVLLAILISIGFKATDTPLLRREAMLSPEGSSWSRAITTVDHVVFGIFLLEFLLRVIADGFIFPKNAFLRKPWNLLDFTILLSLAASILVSPVNQLSGVARFLRISKAFRPLRIINQFSGIQKVFASFFAGYSRLLDLLLVSILFLFPFAIYGTYLFSDRLKVCNDPAVLEASECVGTFLSDIAGHSILLPRVWQNKHSWFNWDSFGNGWVTCFLMASGEGWVDFLVEGISFRGRFLQPSFDPSSATLFHAWFFVAFMLICSIVVINLFIGIVIQNFKIQSGMELLTVHQRQWANLQARIRLLKPSRMTEKPAGKVRSWIFSKVHNMDAAFPRLVRWVVILNTAQLMLEHISQPLWFEEARTYLESFFVSIYTVDVILNVVAFGAVKWASNYWNVIDAAVGIGAAIGIILRRILSVPGIALTETTSEEWFVVMTKFFLVLMPLKLFHRTRRLKTLAKTMMASARSIGNIFSVFGIVLLIYCFLFTEAFGLTRYGPFLDNYANFRSFTGSVLMMIRMTTGEDWHLAMSDSAVIPPYCSPSANYLENDCGDRAIAVILYWSFYVICSYIFLNMFIVIVLDNFAYSYSGDARCALISDDDLTGFKRVWAEFDHKSTGLLNEKSLIPFMKRLRGRFDCRIYRDDETVPALLARALIRDFPDRETSYGRPRHSDESCLARGSQPMGQLDIQKLSDAVSAIDFDAVKRKRQRFNLIYREAKRSADNGFVRFDRMLRVCVMNCANPRRYLRLEELLRRERDLHFLTTLIAAELVVGALRAFYLRNHLLKLRRVATERSSDRHI